MSKSKIKKFVDKSKEQYNKSNIKIKGSKVDNFVQ